MSKRMNNKQIYKMAVAGILTAVIALLSFTPLGYLKVGIIEITFIPIPVVIGAILLGPAYGAFLGGIFGLTSFIQCFGMSALGVVMMEINPFTTALTCFVPRIAMGLLVGIIFMAISKIDKKRIVASYVASVSGAVLNTLLFMLFMGLFFRNSGIFDYLGNSFWAILLSAISVNAALEAASCLVIGGSVTAALNTGLKKKL